MPGTIVGIKNGLKTRLETIPSFGDGRIYHYVPDTQEAPSVTIVPGTFIPGDTKAALQFDSSFGRGSDEYVFTLAVVVSRTVDRAAADQLDKFLAPSGAESIKAAIEADPTLGGAAHFAHVDRVVQYGALVWNGMSFFGAQIVVEVTA